MRKLREIMLKKIGCMTALPKEKKEALRSLAITYEDFPIDGYFYRLGDYILAFPTRTALAELKSCEWGLVTDLVTGEPLALLPDISFTAAERLRNNSYRSTKSIYIVDQNSNQIYLGDTPNFSYQAEAIWIPMWIPED